MAVIDYENNRLTFGMRRRLGKCCECAQVKPNNVCHLMKICRKGTQNSRYTGTTRTTKNHKTRFLSNGILQTCNCSSLRVEQADILVPSCWLARTASANPVCSQQFHGLYFISGRFTGAERLFQNHYSALRTKHHRRISAPPVK